MAIEIVDLPSYKMVDLSTVFCMFTAIEIVDFPMKNGDFPSFLVCLPEGFDVLSQRLPRLPRRDLGLLWQTSGEAPHGVQWILWRQKDQNSVHTPLDTWLLPSGYST